MNTAFSMSVTTAEQRARLIEVAEWLEAGAPHKGRAVGFNMSSYETTTDCGTIHCIAGAVVQFESERLGFDYDSTAFLACDAHDTAMMLCGLTHEQAYDMFITDAGSDELSSITTVEASATIRRYLDTGIVKWEIDRA